MCQFFHGENRRAYTLADYNSAYIARKEVKESVEKGENDN